MSPIIGLGGITLGGSLFAVGLVTGITWVTLIGFVLVPMSGLMAFNLGPAYRS